MKWSRSLITLALVLAAGCYGSHSIDDRDGSTPHRNDTGTPPPPPPPPVQLDLLLLVDNSSSMDEEQRSLASQLPILLSALSERYESIQVGVITTDMGAGGFSVPNCPRPDFGDDGILRTEGSSLIMGCRPMYPPFLSWTAGTQPIESFAAELSCVTTVGVDGCGYEQPLEAVLKALTPSAAQPWTAPGFVPVGTPGAGALDRPFFRNTAPHGDVANGGFIRPDSMLAIVVMTDEEDCSARDVNLYDPASPTYSSTDLNLRCFAHASALHSVERYVEGFAQLRRHPNRLAYIVIAGVPPDLTPPPGESIDWDLLISPDVTTRDDRMEERVDPSMPNRLVPSCNVAELGVAFPPIRILETARGLESRGVRVGLSSICQESYISSLASLLGP